MNRTRMLATAAGLGAVSGLRSLLSPALLSAELSQHRRARRRGGPIRRALASRRAADTLRVLALGETVLDKTSLAPRRIAQPLLLGRAASGALVGAAVGREPRARALGALVGAAAAVVAAHLAYRVRVAAAPTSGARNVAAGLAEDAVALGAGRWLAARARCG